MNRKELKIGMYAAPAVVKMDVRTECGFAVSPDGDIPNLDGDDDGAFGFSAYGSFGEEEL